MARKRIVKKPTPAAEVRSIFYNIGWNITDHENFSIAHLYKEMCGYDRYYRNEGPDIYNVIISDDATFVEIRDLLAACVQDMIEKEMEYERNVYFHDYRGKREMDYSRVADNLRHVLHSVEGYIREELKDIDNREEVVVDEWLPEYYGEWIFLLDRTIDYNKFDTICKTLEDEKLCCKYIRTSHSYMHAEFPTLFIYGNGFDVKKQQKILSLMIENDMIRHNMDGKFYNHCFKFKLAIPDDIPAEMEEEDERPMIKLHLGDYMDRMTGEPKDEVNLDISRGLEEHAEYCEYLEKKLEKKRKAQERYRARKAKEQQK